MYKSYLEIRDHKNGKGVFTKVPIPALSMIMEISGPLLLERELSNIDYNNVLQIGPNSFLGLSGDLDDYLNHSCDPNCYLHVVGNRAFLYSLYVIPASGQLTFDYATTSTDTLDKWQMQCKCGSNKCRRVISGFQYLDSPIFEKYKEKEMLPLYILYPNMVQKR